MDHSSIELIRYIVEIAAGLAFITLCLILIFSKPAGDKDKQEKKDAGPGVPERKPAKSGKKPDSPVICEIHVHYDRTVNARGEPVILTDSNSDAEIIPHLYDVTPDEDSITREKVMILNSLGETTDGDELRSSIEKLVGCGLLQGDPEQLAEQFGTAVAEGEDGGYPDIDEGDFPEPEGVEDHPDAGVERIPPEEMEERIEMPMDELGI